MYSPLDNYPPYSDKQPDIFEANIHKEFRCIHGYINHDKHIVLITLVSINSWEMILTEFPQALVINPFPSTIVCNNFEVIHMSGGILNANENVVGEDEYEFTRSFFKKAPIIIYENTKCN